MKFLLLDCPNLVHRSYYTTGKTLSNGTIYGFLKEIAGLRRVYADYQLVFFWDHGKSKRLEIFPEYKSDRIKQREAMSNEERRSYERMKEELDLLKHEVLWDLGFNNIRWQKGYEADDLVASFIQDRDEKTEGFSPDHLIVSGDQDYYQCLRPRVKILKPQGHLLYGIQQFVREHLIDPVQWHLVKAFSGCASDSIPGVRGVGVATAIQFLRGTLPKTYTTYKRILKEEKIWIRNQKLVKLPFPGVRSFELKQDEATRKRWNSVVKNLGMRSLLEVGL